MSYGQQWSGSTISTGSLYRPGNVGIGFSAPEFPLDVYGNSLGGVNIRTEFDVPALQFRKGTYIRSNGTYLVFQANMNGSDRTIYFKDFVYLKLNNNEIYHAGNLNSSTVDFNAKDLRAENIYTNGKIWAKEIKVSLTNPWPDYVFDESYELRSLKKLDAFVKQNGHLPEVPSAVKIEQEGIDVGQMQSLLLKKIEELSLYVINLDRENEHNKERIKKLEGLLK